jgi:hypothetical protein
VPTISAARPRQPFRQEFNVITATEYPEAAASDLTTDDDMARKPKVGALSALELVRLLNDAGWTDYALAKRFGIAHTNFVRLKDERRSPHPSEALWKALAVLAVREGLALNKLE